MSKRDLIRKAKELGVRFVRLQFSDIHGVTKNVAIPVKELDVALAGNIVFDGSCIEGFVRSEESDMYLVPDTNTFALLPTMEGAPLEARLICNVHNPDGTTFEGCPRSALLRELDEAAALGFSPHAGAELEFFLFEHSAAGQVSTATSDRGSYFDLSPIDRGDLARRDVSLALEDMGIRVEATHHEVSHGQHEIDLAFTDLLSLADAVAVATRLEVGEGKPFDRSAGSDFGSSVERATPGPHGPGYRPAGGPSSRDQERASVAAPAGRERQALQEQRPAVCHGSVPPHAGQRRGGAARAAASAREHARVQHR